MGRLTTYVRPGMILQVIKPYFLGGAFEGGNLDSRERFMAIQPGPPRATYPPHK